jgi:dimethylaniline monooxygenase (N-oxide forming)
LLEKSNDIGGLWRYKEDGYGVMSFTHINVSKYNYAFSDFPFPEDSVEFMHHKHIYDYLKSFMQNFKLDQHCHFQHEVVLIEGTLRTFSLYQRYIIA